jgi:hypothetical protein
MISRSRQQKCRMQTERRVRNNQQGLSQDVREAERPRWLGRCSDADGPPLLKGGGEGEVSRVWRPLLGARLVSNYNIVGDMS